MSVKLENVGYFWMHPMLGEDGVAEDIGKARVSKC